MADEDLLVRAAIRDELSGPLADIEQHLKGVGEQSDKTERKLNAGARGFDNMAGAGGRLAKYAGGAVVTGLKAAAVGVAAVTTALALGAVKAVSWAMDASESVSKFETVFAGVAGNVGKYVDDLSAKYGIQKQALQDAASGFGVFGKAAGISKGDLGAFSKDLVGAGLDLASFYNSDPSEVFQALQSGLSGEAEPLRKFGIFMSDALMKSEAASLGLKGELTEGQKVMVRQSIIMKSLGDASGDMARTSGGLANQWKGLTGRLREGATAIGMALLPAAAKLVTLANNKLGPVIARLSENAPKIGKALNNGDWGKATKLIDQTAGAGGKLKDALDGAITKAQQVPAVLAAIKGGDTAAVSTSVGALIGVDPATVQTAIDQIKGILSDLGTVITAIVVPAFSGAAAVLPSFLTPLGLARDVLGFAAANTGLLTQALTLFVIGLTLAKAVSVGYSAVLAIQNARTTAQTVLTRLDTAATGLNTGVKRIANSTAVTFVGVKALEAAGWVRTTAATVANTAATLVQTGVSKAAAAASKIFAAGQWLVNAALTANPIGLVIALVAGLVAGFILAYNKSSTFRAIVDALWATFKIGIGILGSIIATVAKFLLKWSPLGIAIRLVRDNWDEITGAIDRFIGKVSTAITWITNLKDKIAAGIGSLDLPFGIGDGGDTRTSKASGGSFAGTMAGHAAAMGASGARPRITNAFMGGGGKGRGSGDHQSGRALDLAGSGLNSYRKAIRGAGGYAEFHGSGKGRHLHAVPAQAGDTRTSMARTTTRATPGGGGRPVVIADGAIRIDASGSSMTADDLAAAVAAGIEQYIRDNDERTP